MSSKKFRTLVSDPPWLFGDNLPGGGRGAGKHYPCMTTSELARFPLPDLDDDCFLFMWRPATHSEEANMIARIWGFNKPAGEIIWRKMTKDGSRTKMGMGRTVRNVHETCAIYKKGRPQVLSKSIRSVFDAPVGRHSEKPDAFYELIDWLAPGPKVELFARRQWMDWTCLGNEMSASRAIDK